MVGIGLVAGYMEGPSMQITVHHCGANDSGDPDSIEVTWDEISEGDYEALFGYIPGENPEKDTYLFPTDAMLEEYSDHYYGEWNNFCDLTFRRIKGELDGGRGKCRTRKAWKEYFQSSNHGKNAPRKVAGPHFIESGMERLEHAFGGTWNKKRICDIFLPEVFKADF
jgi:hypothetical protein